MRNKRIQDMYTQLHPNVKWPRVSEPIFDPAKVSPEDFMRQHNPGIVLGSPDVWFAKNNQVMSLTYLERLSKAFPTTTFATTVCNPEFLPYRWFRHYTIVSASEDWVRRSKEHENDLPSVYEKMYGNGCNISHFDGPRPTCPYYLEFTHFSEHIDDALMFGLELDKTFVITVMENWEIDGLSQLNKVLKVAGLHTLNSVRNDAFKPAYSATQRTAGDAWFSDQTVAPSKYVRNKEDQCVKLRPFSLSIPWCQSVSPPPSASPPPPPSASPSPPPSASPSPPPSMSPSLPPCLLLKQDETYYNASSSLGNSFIIMALGTASLLIWCAVFSKSFTTIFALTRTSVICFCFLVFVAISKTVLTKHIFEHLNAPVAMSTLSCIVTAILLFPIAICTHQFRMLRVNEIPTFFAVCSAVAADLAFTNIGLSILPLAFQQSIKSTLPVATIAFDYAINNKRTSREILFIVVGICIGPIIMSTDNDWSANNDILYGVFMLSLAVLAGGLKYVLAHAAIKRYKSDMGVLGFTVWMELVALLLLVPWSIANGEAQQIISSNNQNWLLLIGTSAFGGVRILSQFYFLDETSATSLAASNIAIQVGLTCSGSVFFHDPVTLPLIVGSTITLIMSASYMYLKSTTYVNYNHVDGNTVDETTNKEERLPISSQLD